MAFIDLGDQFIAIAAGRVQPPDQARHFGLVVDDKEAARGELRQAGKLDQLRKTEAAQRELREKGLTD